MQQRPINSLCRALVQDQDYIIEVEKHIREMKYAPRRMEKRSGYFRRLRIPNMMSDKWIHAIPMVVLLCLFTLWWFSYPVNLEIKDGRIVGIHRADHDTPLPLNTRHVALAATATSPIAPVPEDLTLSNEIEALPVSNESFVLYENDEDFVKTTYRADHEMPLSLNTDHVALTTTSATSPIAPVPQDLALGNETEENPVSNESLKLYGNDEAFYKADHADHGTLLLLNTNHVALSTLASVTSPVAPVPQGPHTQRSDRGTFNE
ncbi:hypothetical protein POPTR_009G093700v4 [Populus trichocarpa]|uniref:Transmembrane protein n=1 Tax=Populus trichocarpa TaxID=3694 RepID=B9HS78_POPTR|nr:uncharacterized protein LOC7490312 [Populus trichocarpa]XP_024464806.1 uncharacterized protein LOC7490312 [Populus trichocarpa]XP_052311621.1 uncharacterized protein LOC7490312 [Populus trichocarpa]KAI5576971.1 hypothetical protein BDE02_09G081700 [Populus trichocarpa]KAI5576972.1 hypothetical protein BDE02_09G081700 [Populus trichocarpa]PNT20481.1 hypothetical protein POPTR_009G093700v4 [Populus trichocarpa]|eukprot:XP_002313156.1 uncharacterized protein LOC7490312 [Populus trichocarpa]